VSSPPSQSPPQPKPGRLSCITNCAALVTIVVGALTLVVYLSGEQSLQGFLDRNFPAFVPAIPAPQNATAAIDQIVQQHSVVQNGDMGMLIHIRIRTSNLRDVKCRIASWFYDESNRPVPGFSPLYTDTGGNLSVGALFIPRNDEETYSDLPLFLPYKEVHLTPRTWNLHFDTQVSIVYDRKLLASAGPQTFWVNVPASSK
jgi:hypothetical protein